MSDRNNKLTLQEAREILLEQMKQQEKEEREARRKEAESSLEHCYCFENNKEIKKIYNLSRYAWEQVDKNPEEAKRLFKKIHSIASGGEYMMEHPDFYVDEAVKEIAEMPDKSCDVPDGVQIHKDVLIATSSPRAEDFTAYSIDETLQTSSFSIPIPDEDILDDEEETLLNKLCDIVEAECFGEDFDYDRKRMKGRIQKVLDGEENDQQNTNRR